VLGPLLREWSHFPELLATIPTSGTIWAVLLMAVLLGYIIGVLPGLGATMGMALMLGFIPRLPPEHGIALMMGVLISCMSSSGITSILINIPGTAASAATVLDGYPLFKQGKGKEVIGASVICSAIGTISAILAILVIQPYIFTIALMLGDWEVFLFCVFGVLICGALAGNNLWKGLASAVLGLTFAMVGLETVQAVRRFTFGVPTLLIGIPEVAALLGLFGLSEVFYVLRKESKINNEAIKGVGWFVIPFKTLKDNTWNMVRSLFAGLWVGFLPGIGESAACWVCYDVAKRNSKDKEKFGKGSFEGVIAAETGNSVSSVGSLIPSLSLGIPGSATTAVFIAALFLMDYRPGPTLLQMAPGLIVKIAIITTMAAIASVIVAFAMSKAVTKFFTIPHEYLMPIVVVLCVVGAWGTGFTKHHIIVLFVFGLIGYVMKVRDFAVAPMVLGLLIGSILDVSFRRALILYAQEPLTMFTRPFGMFFTIVLIALFAMGVKSSKAKKA